jgi:hypothetical protein
MSVCALWRVVNDPGIANARAQLINIVGAHTQEIAAHILNNWKILQTALTKRGNGGEL